MHGPLGSTLKEYLKEKNTRVVFPSSVAADFWARECLMRGWIRAIELDRFIGWDRFRDTAFTETDDARIPVGKEIRALFAADLLKENATRPFLENFIPRERAEDWQPFAFGLGRSLPQLRSLVERGKYLHDPVSNDYREIAHRYGTFLSERGFREPAWQTGKLDPRGHSWLIAYPELIEDYEEYADALERDASVRIINIPESATVPPIRIHGSVLDEIGSILSDAAAFLASGERMPDEVVITCPGLEAMRPYMEREAKLQGIPLDFRSGASLAAHPAGRIFSRMQDLAVAAFPYESMRDLLMDSGLSWRENSSARELLAFGARMTVARGWRDGVNAVDAWEDAFKAAGNGAGASMKAFYRGLRTNALALTRAKDFKGIKAAWTAFSRSMLDPSSWRPEADKVIGRCVAALDAFESARRVCGFGDIVGAYGLFMNALVDERYVGAANPGGVRVYDYRVSAGMEVARHYILNASEDLVSVRGGALSFLREDFREGMGFGGRDMSLDFLKVYGISGERAEISCALEGVDGPQMPHGIFEERAMSGDAGEGYRKPVDELEDFFENKAPFPRRSSPSVRKGLDHAVAASFIKPSSDWTAVSSKKRGIEEAGRAALRKLEKGAEDGLLRLSPTMIRKYRACPLSWLWDSVLGAGKEAEGIASLDSSFIGSAYHLALQSLYRVGEKIGPHGANDIARRFASAYEYAALKMARERGPLARVIIEMSESDLSIVLGRLIEIDVETIPGSIVEAIEVEARASFAREGYILNGRIDRLMRTVDGLIIIDYKTTSNLNRNDFAPIMDGDEVKDLSDVQFPAYALMLEKGGTSASIDGMASALAFSIGSRKYLAVAAREGTLGTGERKKPVMDLKTFSLAASKVGDISKKIVEELRGAMYPLPSRDDMEAVCGSCVTRNICRERYNVR